MARDGDASGRPSARAPSALRLAPDHFVGQLTVNTKGTTVALILIAVSLAACGHSPVRGMALRDAVRTAICDAVSGAEDAHAAVHEIEVTVHHTTTVTSETSAGITVPVSISTTGTAEIENGSEVTVHIDQDGLAHACVASAGEASGTSPAIRLFQVSDDGRATTIAEATVTTCEQCCREHASQARCEDDGCRGGVTNFLNQVCLPRCQANPLSCN